MGNAINPEGLLRLHQIIGRPAVTPEQAEVNRQEAIAAKARGEKPRNKPTKPRSEIKPLIPVCATSWWAGVRSGRYPRPVFLGNRTTCWRASDVLALVKNGG